MRKQHASVAVGGAESMLHALNEINQDKNISTSQKKGKHNEIIKTTKKAMTFDGWRNRATLI